MASISKVAIANRALSELKTNRISSMDAESEAARICKLYFDSCLDALLDSGGVWDFAIARATPARLSEAPAWEYDYYFQMPTDPWCIRVLEVVDDSGTKVTDWQVEGRYIACDTEIIKIKYLKRVDNLNELPPLFVEALVFYLAHKIAYTLTGDKGLKEVMFQEYKINIDRAQTKNGAQGTSEKDDDNDYAWLTLSGA